MLGTRNLRMTLKNKVKLGSSKTSITQLNHVRFSSPKSSQKKPYSLDNIHANYCGYG